MYDDLMKAMPAELVELRNRIEELRQRRIEEIDRLIQRHPQLADLDDWLDDWYPMEA